MTCSQILRGRNEFYSRIGVYYGRSVGLFFQTEILALGKTTSHASGIKFGIKANDRRHHIYIVGQTGTGKSTLLKNMAIQDLRRGHGLAVVDPHGQLVEDILHFIPKSRTNEVAYFNPADTEFPIGLNILEAKNSEERNLVASSLISIFKHLWKESWGMRLEHILHNAILALMDTPDSTLLGIYRLLADDGFREKIVERVKDPIVKLFWKEDFENYAPQFKKEVASPIQNKIGQLITNNYIRNIVGQEKSTIDLKFMMDNRRVLLVNLAKGRIGEDKANLLGSVIVTKLYLAALERQNIPRRNGKIFTFTSTNSRIFRWTFFRRISEVPQVSLEFNFGASVFASIIREHKTRRFRKRRHAHRVSGRLFGCERACR